MPCSANYDSCAKIAYLRALIVSKGVSNHQALPQAKDCIYTLFREGPYSLASILLANVAEIDACVQLTNAALGVALGRYWKFNQNNRKPIYLRLKHALTDERSAIEKRKFAEATTISAIEQRQPAEIRRDAVEKSLREMGQFLFLFVFLIYFD